MKGRQYQHRQIRTADGWVVTGREYILRDGNFTARVKLLRDRPTDDALKFRVEVIQSETGYFEAGSRITLTADWEGSGSWQLLEMKPEER
ncbi:MAG: hypothetical protein KDD19_21800 [Phaeodactylibacter sp.]|nr:hypothetical protein [Phaeodactylibacter sp.]MCB9053903.1 hypothetical protein [Lewinellaceae bacterium]